MLWPVYEVPRWSDPSRFQQGIAGSLELFFWAWVKFQRLVGEVTGHGVPMFQRVDQAGFACRSTSGCSPTPTPCSSSASTTSVTEQLPLRRRSRPCATSCAREGTCLVLGPHHDVGRSRRHGRAAMEYLHHGDVLVPRQQRFGGYTRAVYAGARDSRREPLWAAPCRASPGRTIAPLTIVADLDKRGWLTGVAQLQLPHAPAALRADDGRRRGIHVLARQPIDLARPHPFTKAGERRNSTRSCGCRPATIGPATCWSSDSTVLQHAVRRRREPGALLEEPCHGAMSR